MMAATATRVAAFSRSCSGHRQPVREVSADHPIATLSASGGRAFATLTLGALGKAAPVPHDERTKAGPYMPSALCAIQA
jgi:hypothetical protein